MLKNKKLLIIGSGYMGEAIIKGLLSKNVVLKENLCVVNPVFNEQAKSLTKKYAINLAGPQNIKEADIIILAFKPQNLAEAANMYKDSFKEGQLIISILAGVTTEKLEASFNLPMAVIRTMPNLALGAGQSATAYCRGKLVNNADILLAEEIFANLGAVVEIKESDMEAVTALSGSGPGYIYYLAEAMVEGGCNLGLKRDTALALTIQTFLGAAVLLKESGGEPSEMRKKISSAGGSTEAGVKAMEANNFFKAVLEGMKAAHKRTHELGEASKEEK